jgi:hypothetical protein
MTVLSGIRSPTCVVSVYYSSDAPLTNAQVECQTDAHGNKLTPNATLKTYAELSTALNHEL